LQLLILGTPHSRSVTIHNDNLQPRIDKRRNRTFARRTRQKENKSKKLKRQKGIVTSLQKGIVMSLRRWQPC
jgi:hypothetical protein